jgi:hypothetical protein
MESTFKTWETGRQHFMSFFDNYTLEQLNKIPQGFSNNLIWNLGHVIVAQQSLYYKISGLDTYLSTEFTEAYKPGSRPSGQTTQAEVDEIKKLMMELLDKTKEDYSNGVFKNFNPRKTLTGFQLDTLADAIEFNNYHEGMHYGMMLNIRKFV